MGGPFWAAPIHDQEVVDKLLERANAMQAIIRAKQAGTEKEGEEEMESDLVLRAEEGESTPPAQFKGPTCTSYSLPHTCYTRGNFH